MKGSAENLKSSEKNSQVPQHFKIAPSIAFCLAALYLSSCSSWALYQKPLRYFQKAPSVKWLRGAGEIYFKGKMQSNLPASFIINADGKRMRLDFINPFGMVSAVLIATDKKAVIKMSDGSERIWASPEELFRELTGIPFTPQHLFDILTGALLARKTPYKKIRNRRCSFLWNVNGAKLRYEYRCSTGEPLFLILNLPEYTIQAENYTFVQGLPVPHLILIRKGELTVKVKLKRIEFSAPVNAELLFNL